MRPGVVRSAAAARKCGKISCWGSKLMPNNQYFLDVSVLVMTSWGPHPGQFKF